MDNVIQFIANYEGWVAIRKLKVEEKTDARAIMEFLASLGIGIDTKIEENLRKVVDLGRVDAALAEIQEGKGSGKAGEIIGEVASRNVNRIIREICEKPELQKNEQKELIGFCKVYALRKAFREVGFSVDYSSVEIPGMKKLKKKKV